MSVRYSQQCCLTGILNVGIQFVFQRMSDQYKEQQKHNKDIIFFIGICSVGFYYNHKGRPIEAEQTDSSIQYDP